MTLGTDGPVAAVEFVRDWLDEFPLLMLGQDIQIRPGLGLGRVMESLVSRRRDTPYLSPAESNTAAG